MSLFIVNTLIVTEIIIFLQGISARGIIIVLPLALPSPLTDLPQNCLSSWHVVKTAIQVWGGKKKTGLVSISVSLTIISNFQTIHLTSLYIYLQSACHLWMDGTNALAFCFYLCCWSVCFTGLLGLISFQWFSHQAEAVPFLRRSNKLQDAHGMNKRYYDHK